MRYLLLSFWFLVLLLIGALFLPFEIHDQYATFWHKECLEKDVSVYGYQYMGAYVVPFISVMAVSLISFLPGMASQIISLSLSVCQLPYLFFYSITLTFNLFTVKRNAVLGLGFQLTVLLVVLSLLLQITMLVLRIRQRRKIKDRRNTVDLIDL